MSDEWCLIESDPGVFTELITGLGVNKTQVEELYALDDELFKNVAPIYGLVFLFKWTPELERSDDRPVIDDDECRTRGLFFAKQVVQNACATQALLSILLNNEDIDKGETLNEFKAFTTEFPADIKGMSIGNSDTIRSVHNSFTKTEPFIIDKDNYKGEKEDAFHFIAYVPYQGKVYELDGLKPGPICLGDVDNSGGNNSLDWLNVAKPAIETRINRYSGSEIRFNLLALVKDRIVSLQENIETQTRFLAYINQAISAGTPDGIVPDSEPCKSDMELGTTVDELEAQQASVNLTIADYQEQLRDEELKHKKWKEENVRRRHNFIPLAMTILKKLAEKGKLKPAVDSAKERVRTMMANKKK